MDITKRSVGTYQVENRTWLGSQHGLEATDSVSLNLALFASDRYPNGFIPSGTVLSKMDAQVNGCDVYGPYDPASNVPAGSGTATGFLFNSMNVPQATGYIAAPLVKHCKVKVSLLPFASGKGSLDAAGQVDMAGRVVFNA